MHPSNKVMARTLATISCGAMSCSVVHPMHPTHGLQEWIHIYIQCSLLCQYTVDEREYHPLKQLRENLLAYLAGP